MEGGWRAGWTDVETPAKRRRSQGRMRETSAPRRPDTVGSLLGPASPATRGAASRPGLLRCGRWANGLPALSLDFVVGSTGPCHFGPWQSPGGCEAPASVLRITSRPGATARGCSRASAPPQPGPEPNKSRGRAGGSRPNRNPEGADLGGGAQAGAGLGGGSDPQGAS